eukprot:2001157-Amphidinium_carterae.1
MFPDKRLKTFTSYFQQSLCIENDTRRQELKGKALAACASEQAWVLCRIMLRVEFRCSRGVCVGQGIVRPGIEGACALPGTASSHD